MVIIRRDKDSYIVEAAVLHSWGKEHSKHFNGKGYGHITTSYKNYTLFSLNKNMPDFEQIFVKLILECVDEEEDKIEQLKNKIDTLTKERDELIEKYKGMTYRERN